MEVESSEETMEESIDPIDEHITEQLCKPNLARQGFRRAAIRLPSDITRARIEILQN